MKVFVRIVLTSVVAIPCLVSPMPHSAQAGQASGMTTQKETPAPSAGRLRSAAEIDAIIRSDVLKALARELESGYAIEETAKKLAALVRANIAVPAEAALTKAHELAVDRVIVDASDRMQRSMLTAVAMKLQSIAEADSGSVTRLTNAQIAGTYAQAIGPGPSVTILERDGRLVQHIDDFPDVELVFLKGNCSWKVHLAGR